MVVAAIALPRRQRVAAGVDAAFGGAVVTTVVVYMIGTAGGRGSSPITLVLAGGDWRLLAGLGATLEILGA